MINPKPTIYSKLKELKDTYTNLKVYKERPKKAAALPSITYRIESDRPVHTIDKDVPYQRIVVRIDIFTETGSEGSTLLAALEAKMKEIDYLLVESFPMPIPDTSEKYSHITTQFTY